MTNSMSGGCLCGAVRFTATPENDEMGACHCGMCRRWSGGPYLAVSCGESVKVEDEAVLKSYASSEWGERVFCSNCGTSLFWRMRDGSHTSVAVSAFDDPGAFRFTREIFIDEKPGNYAFANETTKMTGAEVVALFAPTQEPQHG